MKQFDCLYINHYDEPKIIQLISAIAIDTIPSNLSSYTFQTRNESIKTALQPQIYRKQDKCYLVIFDGIFGPCDRNEIILSALKKLKPKPFL